MTVCVWSNASVYKAYTLPKDKIGINQHSRNQTKLQNIEYSTFPNLKHYNIPLCYTVQDWDRRGVFRFQKMIVKEVDFCVDGLSLVTRRPQKMIFARDSP